MCYLNVSLTGLCVRLVGDRECHPTEADVFEVVADDELLIQRDVAIDLLNDGPFVAGDGPVCDMRNN